MVCRQPLEPSLRWDCQREHDHLGRSAEADAACETGIRAARLGRGSACGRWFRKAIRPCSSWIAFSPKLIHGMRA